MQIASIQQDKITNFQANLRVVGDTNRLPKGGVKHLQKYAKNIGTKYDTIMVAINPEIINFAHWLPPKFNLGGDSIVNCGNLDKIQVFKTIYKYLQGLKDKFKV